MVSSTRLLLFTLSRLPSPRLHAASPEFKETLRKREAASEAFYDFIGPEEALLRRCWTVICALSLIMSLQTVTVCLCLCDVFIQGFIAVLLLLVWHENVCHLMSSCLISVGNKVGTIFSGKHPDQGLSLSTSGQINYTGQTLYICVNILTSDAKTIFTTWGKTRMHIDKHPFFFYSQLQQMGFPKFLQYALWWRKKYADKCIEMVKEYSRTKQPLLWAVITHRSVLDWPFWY